MHILECSILKTKKEIGKKTFINVIKLRFLEVVIFISRRRRRRKKIRKLKTNLNQSTSKNSNQILNKKIIMLKTRINDFVDYSFSSIFWLDFRGNENINLFLIACCIRITEKFKYFPMYIFISPKYHLLVCFRKRKQKMLI